jgi:hypothetical protein
MAIWVRKISALVIHRQRDESTNESVISWLSCFDMYLLVLFVPIFWSNAARIMGSANHVLWSIPSHKLTANGGGTCCLSHRQRTFVVLSL